MVRLGMNHGVIFAPIWPDKEILSDSVLATMQPQSVYFNIACTLTRFSLILAVASSYYGSVLWVQ